MVTDRPGRQDRVMTQTHDEPHGEAPHPEPADDGPHVTRESLHDIDQLRRSSTDRYVAGVAGGLGRHFGIDPTVIRVVLAALCLFGGAGLLLYAAVWLFVPEDTRAQAPIHVSSDVRRIVLAAAAVIAVLALAGDSWGGFGWHLTWPIAVIAVIAVAISAGSRRREAQAPPEQTAPGFAATPPSGPDAPAAYYTSPPPAPPRRQVRTGPVLFWPTLALIAVGEGLLGTFAVNHHVDPGAWFALPMAIIGAMLLVGAFVGRPGGLIFLGLLMIPPLAISSAVGNLTQWEGRTVSYAPTSSAQVNDSYQITNGRLVVDLSQLRDPAAMAGRSIDVSINAGEVQVILAPGVRTEVSASLGFAGDVEVGDREQSGFNPDVNTVVLAPGATPAGPQLQLTVHGRVGHIAVDQPGASILNPARSELR
jgi:phage shock protein PspC (stress-responsive transcriptional regulator)